MSNISYNKLWKLLIDKGLKKTDLKEMTGIGSTTLAKLGKNEPVSMDVLIRFCNLFQCNIDEIMDIVPEIQK